jgi:hypothetical protein
MMKHAMQCRTGITAMGLFVALAISLGCGPLSSAQAPPPTPPPTPQQLDQLLAPIALYPDTLLAQIMTAATNPQEILDVDNWLHSNSGLKGTALTDAAEKQGFDAAFIALANFPEVLGMMAENIDDYAAIGQGFTSDQAAVSASIQRLRAQAYAAGNLQSNEQQKVEVQQPAGQPVYVIQPANPQVVYVPIYNPTIVYVRPPTPTVVVTFGSPYAVGFLMVGRPWGWMGWGWNWSSHRCYYNHSVWVGWGNPYRPPAIWYHPRPVLYSSRPGYGGNWHYRPPNYRPPVATPRPANRPAWGPNNRPGNGASTRPSAAQQTRTTRPAQPNSRPGTPSQQNVKRPSGAASPGKPSQPTVSRPQANSSTRPNPQPSQPKAQPKQATPKQQPTAKPSNQQKPSRPNGM